MLVLRDVQTADLPSLRKLAAVLNTMNLPDDEEALRAICKTSVASFAEKLDPLERELLFVLEDTETDQLVGTSQIIARHGSRDAPHVYYEVSDREAYSSTVDRHFRHKVLSIAYNYDGPTELGGLVVDPDERGRPEKIGKQLSYIRFLFIAMHRGWFRDRLLAELLPPLLPDGRSLLWEALGKKFTGMGYAEADRLSHESKEFIQALFPHSDIYVSLFPKRVQKVVGEVGKKTRGVQRMLERIGFEYVERIDPFDGGPHFEAETDEVTLVKHAVRATLAPGAQDPDAPPEDTRDMLVGWSRDRGANRFRGVRARVRLDGDRSVALPAEAREALGAPAGTPLVLIPFE